MKLFCTQEGHKTRLGWVFCDSIYHEQVSPTLDLLEIEQRKMDMATSPSALPSSVSMVVDVQHGAILGDKWIEKAANWCSNSV